MTVDRKGSQRDGSKAEIVTSAQALTRLFTGICGLVSFGFTAFVFKMALG